MLTTVHVLTGAVIGRAVKRPLIASVASFAVHYALDAVPHWSAKPVKRFREGGWKEADKKDLILKSVEPLVGIAGAAYMVASGPRVLALSGAYGIIFGWLPDLLVFLEWKSGISRPKLIKKFETKIHRHDRTWRGIAPQIIMVALVVFAHMVLGKKGQ